MYIKKYSKSLFIFSAMAIYNINSMDLTNLKPGQIVQANVLQQQPIEGEDGYWALCNGIVTAQVLEGKSISDLLSQNKLQEFFYGLKDLWQNHVIQNRIKILAKYYIIDILFKGAIDQVEIHSGKLNGNTTGLYQLNLSEKYIKLSNNFVNSKFSIEEQRAICDIIANVAENLVNHANITPVTNIKNVNKFYYYHPIDIFNAFKEEIYKKAGSNITYKHIYQNFGNSKFKKAFSCLKFDFNINFIVSGDNKIRGPLGKEYNINWQDRSKNAQNLSSKVGEQLSDAEIDLLINLILEAKLGFSVSSIFRLTGNIKELFERNSNLQDLAKKFKNKIYQGNTTFVFKYNNHWVSCVVDKKAYESPKFIFADAFSTDIAESNEALDLVNALVDDGSSYISNDFCHLKF